MSLANRPDSNGASLFTTEMSEEDFTVFKRLLYHAAPLMGSKLSFPLRNKNGADRQPISTTTAQQEKVIDTTFSSTEVAATREAKALFRTSDGRNQLMRAIYVFDQAEVEKLLSFKNADDQAIAQDEFGANALIYALKGHRYSIAKRLLTLPSAEKQSMASTTDGFRTYLDRA